MTKTMTKVLALEAEDPAELARLINQVNETHNVFATQTHANVANGNQVWYTAFVFLKVTK